MPIFQLITEKDHLRFLGITEQMSEWEMVYPNVSHRTTRSGD